MTTNSACDQPYCQWRNRFKGPCLQCQDDRFVHESVDDKRAD